MNSPESIYPCWSITDPDCYCWRSWSALSGQSLQSQPGEMGSTNSRLHLSIEPTSGSIHGNDFAARIAFKTVDIPQVGALIDAAFYFLLT